MDNERYTMDQFRENYRKAWELKKQEKEAKLEAARKRKPEILRMIFDSVEEDSKRGFSMVAISELEIPEILREEIQKELEDFGFICKWEDQEDEKYVEDMCLVISGWVKEE